MKKEPKIKIFVSHHKPGYIYEDDVYVPIQVGKKNAKVDLGILGDDTGDNISEKNSNYAELTAQYWVWKNYDLSNVDYVGFCHYRRYMTYCHKPNIFNYIFAKNFYSPLEEKSGFFRWKLIALKDHNCLFKFNKSIIKKNTSNLIHTINNGDVDVYFPKKNPLLTGIIKDILSIKSEDLIKFGDFNSKENDLSKECIKLFTKIYPEQKDIIPQIAKDETRRQLARRHLFIMKKDLFIKYAERLFNYLFQLEKLIDDNHLDTSTHRAGKNDGRFMGIFSESLINYWIKDMQNKENIKVSYKANTLMFTDYYF